MADRTVSVVLKADIANFTSGMQRAAMSTLALKSAVDKAQATQTMAWTNISRGAMVAGAGLVVLAKQSIKAASDMAETQNKVKVIFGDSSEKVKTWGETSARSMGMSSRTAVEAAATYGNLFVGMGIVSDKAAGMSMRMVQLAADLASLHNTSPEQALGAIQSGLVGMERPLRQYGIVLDAAGLKQEAFALGLTKSVKGALTPAEKALASYSLILKAGAVANGDYKNTADGLANSQKTLNAEWDNAKEKMGADLIGPMAQVTGMATSMLGSFNSLPPEIRNVAMAAVVLGVGLLILIPKIAATATALKGLNGSAVKSLGVAAGLAAVGATIAGIVTQPIGDWMFGATVPADQLTGSLLKLGVAGRQAAGINLGAFGLGLHGIGQEIEHLQHPGVQQRIEDLVGSIGHLSNTGGEGRARVIAQLGQVDQALGNMITSGNAKGAESAFKAIQQSVTDAGGDVSGLSALLPIYAGAVEQAGTVSVGAAGNIKTTGLSATIAKQAMEGLKTATDNLKTSLDGLVGKQLTADTATAAMNASYDQATATIKQNGETVTNHSRKLDLTTQKGRDNAAALQGIVTSALSAADAYKTAGISTAYIGDQMTIARGKFVASAEAAGLNKVAANRLATAYGLVPKDVVTTIKASGVDAASSAVAGLKAQADALNGTTAVVTTVLRTVNETVSSNGWGNAARPGPWRSSGTSAGATGGLFTGDRFHYATGGPVNGPGGPKEDKVPALLSAGEFVLNAAAVGKYGVATLLAMNAQRLAQGGVVGLKAGSKSAVRKRKEKRLATAKTDLQSALDQRQSSIKSTASSLAGGMSFDVNAHTQSLQTAAAATKALADAQTALNDARRVAMATGGSPSAMAALASAQDVLTAAQVASNAANKDAAKTAVTGSNIVADMAARAAAMEKFSSTLARLRRMGLNGDTLGQLAAAGVDSGGAQASALLAGGRNIVGRANRAQSRIGTASTSIGGLVTDYSTIAAAQREVRAAQRDLTGPTRSRSSVAAPTVVTLHVANDGKPVILRLDSKDIQQGLLRLKRTQGGLTLGLA